MKTLHVIASASVLAILGIVGTDPAHAANFDWNFASGANTGAVVAGNSISATNNSQTITAEGYQAAGNGAAKLSTGLISSRLYNFQNNGLGASNSIELGQGTLTPTAGQLGASLGSAPAPEHTMSNEINFGGTQVTDMIVFQLPTISGQTLSISSIVLNAFVGLNGHANVTVLVGGDATTTFANIAGKSITTLESAGAGDKFSALEFGGTALTTVDHTAVTLSSAALSNLSGSYLIIAASLNDPGTAGSGISDFIKVDTIHATSSTTIVKVPEPGSLALFGVGLAGVFYIRRRQARKAA